MKFTGQPRHEKIDINVMYRAVFQDAELPDVFVAAIKALATAVGAARVKDISNESEVKRWAKEFLVGYGLLAIGEARSMLLLFSDGLNIHARIHLRALYEYELKVKLLLEDDARVIKFRDAFAYEMRDFGKRLGAPAEDIDAEIERVLGIQDASSVIGTKENHALGGTVKEQMKDELQPEKRYLGTFAWTSQVSHGSVLALHELANATDGKADDLLSIAARDNKSNALLYYAFWVILQFVVLLEQEFKIAVPGIQELNGRATSINARLQIVTLEQETRILKMREEKLKDPTG